MTQKPRMLFAVVIGVLIFVLLAMAVAAVHAQDVTTPHDRVQDEAIVADQIRQDVMRAKTSEKIQVIEAQSVTDRQIISYLILAMFGIVGVGWFMQYNSARKIQAALDNLAKVKAATLAAVQGIVEFTAVMTARTELLEAHIAVTTPEVLEEHRAKLAALKGHD